MVDVVISGAPVRAEIGEALREFFPAAEPREQVSWSLLWPAREADVRGGPGPVNQLTDRLSVRQG
jgi:hypothetical protein